MKHRSKILAVAIGGTFLFAGCNQSGTDTGAANPTAAAAPKPKPEDILASVNGKPITKESVKILSSEIEQRRGPQNIPEDKIVDELVSRELLKQEVEKLGLTSSPEVAARVDNALRMTLSQIGAEHFVKTVQVTDEEVKKEYEQRVGEAKRTEFKGRHILVETEAEAKDLLAKLQKGAKFDELAKKFSKDPGSKAKGGDLGWFNPQQMVPPFAAAIAELKNGETSSKPVQTQFGWHIIQREDSRDQAPPPFDQVKEQIKNLLQTQKLQQHLAELKTAAKIERAAPPEKKDATSASPAPEQAAPPETGAAGNAPKPTDPSIEAGKPVPAQPATPAPIKK